MTKQRDGYDWTVDDSADARDREYLSDRINEFNFSTTGIYDGKELSFFCEISKRRLTLASMDGHGEAVSSSNFFGCVKNCAVEVWENS